MNRFRLLLMPIVTMAALAASHPTSAATINQGTITPEAVNPGAINPGTTASTALDPQVMKIALHTATPEEEGFIEHVLKLVNKKKLPLDMVQSTFLWAKRKPRLKFQYFKWGLTWRAEQAGLSLAD
jgi:hypothetical protein